MRNKIVSFADKNFYQDYSENIQTNKSGEQIFKDTNLSVFYVGSLLTTESKMDILEDYPYLDVLDLKYAKIHYTIESNKRPEELAPDFDPVKNTIDKFRDVINKKEKTI